MHRLTAAAKRKTSKVIRQIADRKQRSWFEDILKSVQTPQENKPIQETPRRTPPPSWLKEHVEFEQELDATMASNRVNSQITD
jgi:hypothetical protein